MMHTAGVFSQNLRSLPRLAKEASNSDLTLVRRILAVPKDGSAKPKEYTIPCLPIGLNNGVAKQNYTKSKDSIAKDV